MKTFAYKTITTGKSTYGGTYQYAVIYQIKQNDLIYIGKTRKWCTISYRGEISEVNEWLLENNIIPKIWSRGEPNSYYEVHKCRGGYYTPYYYNRIDTSKYQIKEI